MNDEVNDMTDRLLTDAGVAEGMRVLDFGCGRGDVSFMVARRVGASGSVLGVDHDLSSLVIARERGRKLGWSTVTFTDASLEAIAIDHPQFDAVVGRRVLMYLPNPIVTLSRIAAMLRPGGLMCFQEHDATLTASNPTALPLFERAHDWIWDTVVAEGANPRMGFELHRIFERAGFVIQGIRAEAVVQTPRTPRPLGEIVRAMLPRIVARGIATEGEIQVDTLDQRLLQERIALNATSISELIFGAWARKPACAQ